jgi:hypothetical protein
MIALLGSVLGLFGSVLPEIAKFFQDKRDKKHELEMLRLQAENADKLRDYDAKLFAAQAEANFDIAEQERIAVQQKNDRTDIKWVDAFNAVIRPTIALGFLLLYAFIKIMAIVNIGADVFVSNPWLVWNDEDSAIWAGVISFYFGSRAFKRTMGR